MGQDPIETLKKIKLLILDVDGVLTDGKIVYTNSGEETKTFHVKDGLGIRLLLDTGIQVAIVTGRRSDALHYRCRDLGISAVFDGINDKTSVLPMILDQTGVSATETAAVGDDLPDLPLMRRVGYAIAVADADEIVKQHADKVTMTRGGAGAVREICEMILKSQGIWDRVVGKWTG